MPMVAIARIIGLAALIGHIGDDSRILRIGQPFIDNSRRKVCLAPQTITTNALKTVCILRTITIHQDKSITLGPEFFLKTNFEWNNILFLFLT